MIYSFKKCHESGVLVQQKTKKKKHKSLRRNDLKTRMFILLVVNNHITVAVKLLNEPVQSFSTFKWKDYFFLRTILTSFANTIDKLTTRQMHPCPTKQSMSSIVETAHVGDDDILHSKVLNLLLNCNVKPKQTKCKQCDKNTNHILDFLVWKCPKKANRNRKINLSFFF